MTVRLVSQRIELNAPVAEVFRHLTTVEGLLRWMAVDALVQLEPIWMSSCRTQAFGLGEVVAVDRSTSHNELDSALEH